MTTADQIQDFIHECKPESAELSADDDLIRSGVLDSVTIYRVVSFIAGTWQIDVRDEDLVSENFASVAAIADYVTRSRNGAGPGKRA